MEHWWEPQTCKPCMENNGGKCACEYSGNCKCLEHEAAKVAGVAGNPWIFLERNAELCRFAKLVRNAVVLSPPDIHGTPTLQSLAWMDIETPYSAETTQILAFMVLEQYSRRKT